MRRNSSGVVARRIVFALVLALALMLISSGIASAAPRGTTTSSAVLSCLDAAPATQNIGVGATAYVKVEIKCYPSQIPLIQYLTAIWGDGSTTRYPICVEVCHVPPFTIATSHVYTSVGDYFPAFCLGSTASSTVPDCTRVEIRVLLEATPLATPGVS